MPFRVSGKNIDVGEALRERVNARVAEALAKYFDGGFSGHVTIGRALCSKRKRSRQTLMQAPIKQRCASKRGCGVTSVGARIVSVDGQARGRDARGPHRNRRAEAGSLPRRARDEREATAWNPLTIAESMTALKCLSVSEALKELDTTARSGARVASRWTRPRQSGLSPRGRPLTAS